MRAIGIDIGTTSVCGILIDAATGRIEKSIAKNSNAFIKGCAVWEKIQSVDKIMTVATGILERLIAGSDDVGVIGVTGQMHGIVYTDKEGNAVSPLYTWQDGRGNLPYKDTTCAKHLSSFSGYGNVTDFYNTENGIRPESAVSYCTIHDYFVMRLCGLKKPIMHTSDAASFGCYDLENNRFNYACSAEITGDYRIAGGYKGIPVSVAIGDNQASVFSTLTDEDDVLVNIGTGSQISVISDKIAESAQIETRPYFEGKYLLVGAALCGGRAYSLLKNFYAEAFGYIKRVDDNEVYKIMNDMLKDAKKGSFKVDTRFAGTRLNSEITGGISGITTDNFTPSALTYGVLCGMADELLNMYEQTGVRKSGIVGSGNGIRKNKALVKIFEEKLGAKMKIPKHLEEAAVGAAMYGMVAHGEFKNRKAVQEIIVYQNNSPTLIREAAK